MKTAALAALAAQAAQAAQAALAVLLIASAASMAAAQTTVSWSGGDVSRPDVVRFDAARLNRRIPGVSSELRDRVQIGGDSAQRIAMGDFDWRGRVASVEFDEEDARLFWDVKIVPDTSDRTIVRYRVDAASGGILGIREFSGVPGLTRRSARKP